MCYSVKDARNICEQRKTGVQILLLDVASSFRAVAMFIIVKYCSYTCTRWFMSNLYIKCRTSGRREALTNTFPHAHRLLLNTLRKYFLKRKWRISRWIGAWNHCRYLNSVSIIFPTPRKFALHNARTAVTAGGTRVAERKYHVSWISIERLKIFKRWIETHTRARARAQMQTSM